MLRIIGIGPGSKEHMTYRAAEAIATSQVIVGYKTYIDLIQDLITDQEVVQNGMKREVERCEKAIEIARSGKTVAVISSGDAGVYGMAGLVLELLGDETMAVEIVPGVTASSAAASIAGAPLMHDYCHISLSDLLTPMDQIQQRVRSAVRGGFVICFYNPRSKGRPNHLEQAFQWIKEETSEDLAVAVVKDAHREGQACHYGTVDDFDFNRVDMTSLVIVGNRTSRMIQGKLVTPRGYLL